MVGVLASASPVPMEKVPELRDEQFESVINDGDIMLCHMQPREESAANCTYKLAQSGRVRAIQLRSLVQEHADVFSNGSNGSDLVEHDIEMSEHLPIKQPPCRIPFLLRPKVETLVQEMLSQGVGLVQFQNQMVHQILRGLQKVKLCDQD